MEERLKDKDGACDDTNKQLFFPAPLRITEQVRRAFCAGAPFRNYILFHRGLPTTNEKFWAIAWGGEERIQLDVDNQLCNKKEIVEGIIYFPLVGATAGTLVFGSHKLLDIIVSLFRDFGHVKRMGIRKNKNVTGV